MNYTELDQALELIQERTNERLSAQSGKWILKNSISLPVQMCVHAKFFRIAIRYAHRYQALVDRVADSLYNRTLNENKEPIMHKTWFKIVLWAVTIAIFAGILWWVYYFHFGLCIVLTLLGLTWLVWEFMLFFHEDQAHSFLDRICNSTKICF